MIDPVLLPWWPVWAGLVIAVSGAVLAMHGFGQRRPSWVADVGGAIVAVGFVLMIGTVLANGCGTLANLFRAKAEETYVWRQSPDH